MKAVKIARIILNLVLGGMLVFGGIKKFEKPSSSPTEIIEKVKAGEQVAPSTEILKIKNFIFGMKQSGYFWQFLGCVELLAGVLLISQLFSTLGAFIALPLTLNIFLFHLYLEPREVGELLQMLGLLIVNCLLLGFSYRIWKPLLYDRNILKFS